MMIVVDKVNKTFSTLHGPLKALDDVSLEIRKGTTTAVVGESGCGKSTLGKILLRLDEPSSGSIWVDGIDILKLDRSKLKQWRQKAQIIFQDPYASLNPSMTAEAIVQEPLRIHNIRFDPSTIRQAFEQVSLDPAYRNRYPHEFSGGQRQRLGIARALILRPNFIVCDEPIAALDVSVQAQIVNLLQDLQIQMGLTYLFISHDLRMVHYLADFVCVMYMGKVVEQASKNLLYKNPLHPYTQALISAIPVPKPLKTRERNCLSISGEVPSPIHLPKGCAFHTRCPHVMPICKTTPPPEIEVKAGHKVRCHLY